MKTKNPLTLNDSQINSIAKTIRQCFYTYCDTDIIRITDEIKERTEDILGRMLDDDTFYDILDKYKQTREEYTSLAYHLNLYHRGDTRREWFINLCED